MSNGSDLLVAQLLGSLRTSVNRDGGWGYFPGKASRLEPTCWSLLALRDAGNEADDEACMNGALALLASWQRAGGLLCETPSTPANLAFNGLAATVIQRALATPRIGWNSYERMIAALLTGIVGTKGVRLSRGVGSRQDSQLVGWPWNDGTYSWVEPTSWCLLALKKASRRSGATGAAERITEAERLLVDRCGLSGGWTVGSSNVMGKELSPYVPTTALSLLALQDRSELPQVVRSVAWLTANWPRERSAMALSMALIAMKTQGVAAGDLEQAIRDHVAGAGPPANLSSVALVIFALTGPRHGHAALRV